MLTGYWLGMKRWTDDISWCPSRMEGNFLVSLSRPPINSCSISILPVNRTNLYQIYREVTRQKRSANPKKDTITSASTTRSPISTAIEKRTPYSKSMAQVKQNGLMKKVNLRHFKIDTYRSHL